MIENPDATAVCWLILERGSRMTCRIFDGSVSITARTPRTGMVIVSEQVAATSARGIGRTHGGRAQDCEDGDAQSNLVRSFSGSLAHRLVPFSLTFYNRASTSVGQCELCKLTPRRRPNYASTGCGPEVRTHVPGAS